MVPLTNIILSLLRKDVFFYKSPKPDVFQLGSWRPDDAEASVSNRSKKIGVVKSAGPLCVRWASCPAPSIVA